MTQFYSFLWLSYIPLSFLGLECKSRKSRDTWSNRQVWPRSTKWSRALWSWQTPLSNTRANATHRHHQMFNTEMRLIISFAAQDGEVLYSQQKTRPKAVCGSYHDLLIAKFRLKLNKVGKIIRSFSYDLNQIPYDDTVEVTNRSKGLDLVDRVPEELWMEVPDCRGGSDQNHPKEKEMQAGKVVVWESFTNSWGKKRSKS